jgi:small subunit ribosomal protein S21
VTGLGGRLGLHPCPAGLRIEVLCRVRSTRRLIDPPGVIGLEVTIQDGENLERALRRFKRKVQRSGLYSELRKRRYYEKPSAQRKRKREAAIRRERRRQRRVVVRR